MRRLPERSQQPLIRETEHYLIERYLPAVNRDADQRGDFRVAQSVLQGKLGTVLGVPQAADRIQFL